jgi:hypothetical protein
MWRVGQHLWRLRSEMRNISPPIGFPNELRRELSPDDTPNFWPWARMALRPGPFHTGGTTARRQMRAKKLKIDKCSACRGTGVIKVEGASCSGIRQLPRCPRCGGTGIATGKSHILDGWTNRPGQLPSSYLATAPAERRTHWRSRWPRPARGNESNGRTWNVDVE